MKKTVLSIVLLIMLVCYGKAQEYSTLDRIERLREVYLNYDNVQISTLGQSAGGHTIPLIIVGKDDPMKPGILLTAGIDGNHPAGSYIAINIIEHIVTKKSNWLNDKVLYVIPILNPDAYNQYFSQLKYERHGNGAKTDADRDGLINEDPYDDLNNDGLITSVRIEDPSGDMTVHKSNDKVLIPITNRDSAEMIYRVISEGIDNDKDGQFNEDGPEGVHINKNFAFKYPAFTNSAGEHAMSEIENRLLADFLFDHYNIHTVINFGMENTMSYPEGFDKSKVKDRVITGPLKQDAEVNEFIGKLYKKSVDYKGAPKMPLKDGGFTSWAYFHYGRFSYSTPGWWAPIVDMPKDTSLTADKPNGKSGKKDDNSPYDLQYINWAEQNSIEDYYVDWTEIDHPDFSGMKAEVGGFKPFVRYNPPKDYLKPVIEDHYNFLNEVVSRMPRFEIQGIVIDKLDKDTYRVRGKAVNTGLLPTHSEIGDKTRWVRKIRSQIILGDNQSLIMGQPKDFHSALQPGGAIEFNYLISGKGKITFEVGSPMTGLFSQDINLD